MTLYFVSYVITRDATGETKNGWAEVPFDGPVDGEKALKKLVRKMAEDMADKEWLEDGDHISVTGWRRFEAPE
jgi:hypothetical protein